ncbi:MAG: nicotinate (nicotinamide) nucleotide adenylyltransferase, partial [Oscillospiraceae bacterium]|nr:nicotinate (nicotinamide) nucleotide adenylyltransferase [Oscillospiraceae bacterium]
MDRIGIYGGTFNPPHTGHIRGAQYAIDALRLKQLLLIPSYIAPHKVLPANSPTPEQRREMVQIAAKESMQVCDMELRRGGTSYTYETLETLAQQYPANELVLLMGTDMFLSFLTWKEPMRILQKASIGVMYRGDPGEMEQIESKKAELENMGATVYLVKNPVTAISSTQLRRMLVFRCADSFLPAGVADYILKNNLYGTESDYRGLPIEELEEVVTSLVKPERVAHVLGCRDTAIELAEHWGADVT